MQSSRFSGFPITHSSFQQHRASIDHPRFPLNLTLTLSKPATSPAWAALPTPPMSGTSPPQTPRDTTQTSSRRRKRSDTPPGTTSSVTTIPSLIDQSPFSYGVSPPVERREDPSMSIATQSLPYLPPLTYGLGAGLPLSHLSPPDISSSSHPQVSPRATRKTKAHVASACINCKKKHLRCDNSRPCRRCVQGGKEDTCKDVEHKKRGRPPLKPEDSISIGRARELGPAATSHYYVHGAQLPGHVPRLVGGPAYPPILPSAHSTSYMAPFARPPSRSSVYSGSQSQYVPAPAAHNAYSLGASGYAYARTPSAQPGMSLYSATTHSMQAAPPSHGARSTPSYGPDYPFQTVQPEAQAHTSHLAPQMLHIREQAPALLPSESSHGFYGPPSLQLPPIRPGSHAGFVESAAPAQHVTHASAPGMSLQQTSMSARSGAQHGGQYHDSKRPKMDIQGILGPRHD